MDTLLKRIQEQAEVISGACKLIKLDSLEHELAGLLEQSNEPSFWNDAQKAGAIMKEQSALQSRIAPWYDRRPTSAASMG